MNFLALAGLGLGTCAWAQLETRSTAPVISGPISIATGDFNHDGKLDMAVASQGANTTTLTILLGRGDGTFQPGVQYSVADDLYSIAAADFNRDGNLDLVTADYLNSQVSVLMGNGDGTFQSAVTLPVGYEPKYVAIGDFNGDKKPDVAIPDYHFEDVYVLLNTGAVAFSPTTPLNFKSQTVGTTSAPLTVTLTNTGSTALTISSMKVSTQFGMTNTCGSSVAAGANCEISVTFSPTSTGAKSGT